MLMYPRGGMRERLKRVVLKTTVRETVPGVRIPLPPPYARDCLPVEVLRCAQDFACGLPLRSRPQIGSSSNPSPSAI